VAEFLRIKGARNTSGDGTAIIAAPPAGQEIAVLDFRAQLLAAPSGTSQDVELKGGAADSAGFPHSLFAQGEGGFFSFAPPLRMGDGQPVFINLVAADEVEYWIRYQVVTAYDNS